jgi:hypothetical protein
MQNTGIAIDVEHADALSRPVDVLVLKYAQNLYGADHAAAARLAVDRGQLPGDGAYLLVPAHTQLAAESVLFLGVPPLREFGYAEIRRFGERALSVVADQRPDARDVAMTIHGPGYGLDEIEAFESQIAGVFDAMNAHQIPARLRSVLFLERDQRRAQRLRAVLRRLLPGIQMPSGGPLGATGIAAGTARHLRSVGYDAQQKMRAFVAMPFADEFVDTFHFGIAAPIRQAGLLCERMDTIQFVGDVVEQMTARIGASRLVIADLTTNNPNVYLEVGYAWGRDVPTVLLCRESHEVMFDVRGHRYLRYRNIVDLADQLGRALTAILNEPTDRDDTARAGGA